MLKAVTKASPAIADYPFTTLTPNLGVSASTGATLADLPGLIGGAHHGRGLGRNFLRHLRRARVVLHVVDASAEDPVADYRVIRDELRMYNPEYVMRPHIGECGAAAGDGAACRLVRKGDLFLFRTQCV